VNIAESDKWMPCPSCHGKGEVPRVFRIALTDKPFTMPSDGRVYTPAAEQHWTVKKCDLVAYENLYPLGRRFLSINGVHVRWPTPEGTQIVFTAET